MSEHRSTRPTPAKQGWSTKRKVQIWSLNFSVLELRFCTHLWSTQKSKGFVPELCADATTDPGFRSGHLSFAGLHLENFNL